MKRAGADEVAGAAVSGYEYLDHTADIQLHAWAPTLKETFELLAVSMFNYITELERVHEVDEVEVDADGHDMESLLYSYMDNLLFQFNGDYFVCKRVEIVEFDRVNWKIKAKGFGETYDKSKHVPGTEIKAITYSAMQIHETDHKQDVFMIVDI